MHRTPRRASIVVASALALLASLTSCATTTGVIVGPVTAPMGFVYTRGIPEWARWVIAPLTVPLGPVIGLVQGVQCDVGYVKHGAYGVDRSPEFGRVFDPLSTDENRWQEMHGMR